MSKNKKHLAIFNHRAIEQIFKGEKTVESRFSQRKIAPFGVISRGDLVYIKPPGEEIVGEFRVGKVIFLDGITDEDWKFIKLNFGKKLSFGNKVLDGEYFDDHSRAQYGTIIFMDQVEQFITSPIKVNKKDLRGWVVL